MGSLSPRGVAILLIAAHAPPRFSAQAWSRVREETAKSPPAKKK